jgi:periplasmic protein TonB
MITELEEKKQPTTIQPPKNTARKAPAHSNWDDEEQEVSGFKKWRVPIIVGIALASGIGFFAQAMSKKTAAPPPKQEPMKVTIVAPPPPPPPQTPPPPPPQAEEKKQEMIEEVKEEEAPAEPTPQVETALKGSGNTGMTLKSGNGSGVFTNRNTVSAERLRWSAYAGQVKSRIGQVLESHPKTRKASMQLVVHVWLDDTGRITRAKLDGSSSDSALDAAIRDEILPGLQISGPPPQGMPMPINMRITARRPN